MTQVDLETFLKKWTAQDGIEYRHDIRTWMQETYHKPFSFWEDLFALKFQDKSATVLFEKYDFYSDCIIRHLGKDLEALKILHPSNNKESCTYDDIHTYVEAQAAHWAQSYAAKAGQTVALILPYGIHYIVALMTALRLGLIVSIVPLEDRFFPAYNVHTALDQIKPDLVVSLSGLDISEKWAHIKLDLTLQRESSSTQSYAYSAGEMVQKHLDLLNGNHMTWIEATRSYLAPIRDGMIALQLKEGTKWARPFHSMYLQEPSCTLTALLAGATIIHVPERVLMEDPQILKDEPVEILGISPPLLEIWLKTPGAPVNKLKLWYRDPLYGNDRSWKSFSEQNKLQKIPTTLCLFEKEKGGITLFSQPLLPEIFALITPSLGSPWKLLKIGSKGEISSEGFGLFQVEPAGERQPFLIISQIGDAWTVSASTSPLREGIPYPIQAIEEATQRLDHVQASIILPERHPEHYLHQQFVLLLFVLPKQYPLFLNQGEEIKAQIQEIIRNQIGAAFVPDRIHFYPIYPKRDPKGPSRTWVESQYQDGSLLIKQSRLPYLNLNLLRQSIYEKIAYNRPLS